MVIGRFFDNGKWTLWLGGIVVVLYAYALFGLLLACQQLQGLPSISMFQVQCYTTNGARKF